MSKYIEAERLIAEIKALKHRKGFLPIENTEITEAYMARGVQFTCDDIVNIIAYLQQEQPEVDLDGEIARFVEGHYRVRNDETLENGSEPLTTQDLADIACHFAAWGAENKAQELRGEVAKVKTRIWQDGFNDGYATATEQPAVDLEKTVEFECIDKKMKMTVQELINYYIDSECCDVAEECGF